MRMLLTAALLSAVALAPVVEAREVWTAARVLMPGDTLRADDADVQEVTGGRDRPELMGTDTRFVGMEVKRRLAAGTPFSTRDIGPPDLVRASQPVRLFWRQGGIVIEMEGRALESGPMGAEVRVSNGRAGRTLRATVVADGTAEVRSLSAAE